MRMTGPTSNLHQHLRSWRSHKKLTLQFVADKIGSKVNTISGWETGKRTVDLDDIEKLAAAYGVHPAALLFAPNDPARFEAIRGVLTMMEQLDPEQRAAWLEMGRQLAKPPS
jgi:transcriptional regulator with XRE-family HTH domain